MIGFQSNRRRTVLPRRLPFVLGFGVGLVLCALFQPLGGTAADASDLPVEHTIEWHPATPIET